VRLQPEQPFTIPISLHSFVKKSCRFQADRRTMFFILTEKRPRDERGDGFHGEAKGALFVLHPADNVRTEYEENWSSRGFPIYRIEARFKK